MKIVFCLGSMGKGGAERVVANLSNYLVKKEHQITIITTISGNSVYPLNKKIKHDYLDEQTNKQNFILKNIDRVKKLKKYLIEINPDIIVSLLPEPSFRVLFLKDSIKKPIIVSVRNDPKIEYRSKKIKKIMDYLYPKADGFIFQTEQAKQYFTSKIQSKSTIIPNPISEEFIKEGETVQKEKVIITIGRLEEQKNQKLLIEAFEEIYHQFPEYQLHIYGEGSLRKELQRVIDERHLENCVKLLGETNEIKEKLEKSEIFVLASNYEGMPNTLMEAMAVGLPCIATDCPCGGPAFLIQDNKNGKLVRINEKQELVEAIKELIENETTRQKLAQEAKKIRMVLNPNKIYQQWEEYIIKIVEERKEGKNAKK